MWGQFGVSVDGLRDAITQVVQIPIVPAVILSVIAVSVVLFVGKRLMGLSGGGFSTQKMEDDYANWMVYPTDRPGPEFPGEPHPSDPL